MVIKKIDGTFSICKVENFSKVNFDDDFIFVAKTDEEFSIVCRESRYPINTLRCDKGWNMLKIDGELDFSLVGIISKISTILADNKIPVFVVSTFNTDYILIKDMYIKKTIEVLSKEGYEIV